MNQGDAGDAYTYKPLAELVEEKMNDSLHFAQK
jgi:hypothetical protein